MSLFEDMPTQVQKSRSIKNKIIVIFFMIRDILTRIVLENQRTVTTQYI